MSTRSPGTGRPGTGTLARLVAGLAIRDLLRQKVHLVCNVAVLAGVLVPLLVLFGVKNGVYDALVGQLLNDPATLRIDTIGNSSFSEADAAEVRGWPEVQFVTLKTRSIFDFVNVRRAGEPGRRDATLVPSGAGDPTLPAGVTLALGPGAGTTPVAVSDGLARQLDLAPGTAIELVTQAEDRPRQLLLPATVAAVLPAGRMAGRAVLADIAVLDLVEAFYDDYALPEHGITAGRPLAGRRAAFEGMRVFARDLESLAALQARLEARFDIRTEARTADVESVLGLGKNLDLALLLTAAVAAIGLAAALVFGFWGEVARKRQTIATLALLGIGGRGLWFFPVMQALVSAVIGLAVSFGLYAVAARAAARLFGGSLGRAGGLVTIPAPEAAAIAGLTLAFVLVTSLAAARSASRADPAAILREGH